MSQAPDLAAAIGDLNRATRNFSRRFGEAADASPAAAPGDRVSAADDAFEARLRAAEREAREYLERAKARADGLVASMIGAVEREVASIRREAEQGARAHRQQAEAEAQSRLEEANRVGEGMVAERQRRLSELSDGIAERAEALTAGLEDAERVRVQFAAFVRALSATAEGIAAEAGPVRPQPIAVPREPRSRRDRDDLAA